MLLVVVALLTAAVGCHYLAQVLKITMRDRLLLMSMLFGCLYV